jgi:recombination associated protein RdgC
MWFKNIHLLHLPTAPWDISLTDLEAALAAFPLLPCTGQNLRSRGFVSPRNTPDERLIHVTDRQFLCATGFEQKLLPASIVRQETEARALQIEHVKGYKPGRRMLRDLKEQVTSELLPRAFVRRDRIRAWIDPQRGWLCIDTTSPSKGDEVVEILRDAFHGSFAVRIPEPAQAPSHAMTTWLMQGDAPGPFTLGDECELCGTDMKKPLVRYLRHDLDGKELKQYLREGKIATRLSLIWNDRVSFVLTEKLQIKKIKFLDIDATESEKSPSADEQFDQDFSLMTGKLGALLNDLAKALEIRQ